MSTIAIVFLTLLVEEVDREYGILAENAAPIDLSMTGYNVPGLYGTDVP
jgi:hypothetical protein